jgi:PKD repeat protein
MIGGFFNPILQGGTAASMDVDFVASTQSAQIGIGITFSNLSDPTPIFNFWEFGDGSFSTASNPTKSFLSPGDYTITLNAVDNNSGGIEEKIDYIDISKVFLLDSYPGATAAFSTSRISSTYNGDCMIVRRSTDNATQSIGFSNNELDTTSLLSFAGAGNAFITTWFDQSNSNNNVISGTAANQPRIVNNGTLETLNGRPAPRFLGNTSLIHTTTTKTFSQPLTIFNVSKLTASSGIDASIIYDSLAASGDRCLLYHTGNTESPFNTFRYGAFDLKTISSSTTNTLLTTTIHSGTASLARTQGVQRHIGTTDSPGTQSLSGLTIGGLRGLNTIASQYAFSGHIAEFIMYDSNKNADLVGIESIINSYWLIY